VAVFDFPAPVTTFTGIATTHSPGLESGFAIALKEQPNLAERARFVGVAHPVTLAQPILETAGGGLQGGACRPAGYFGGSCEFASGTNEPEPLRDTGHLPTGASGHLLCHECVTEPLGSGDILREVLT